MAANVAFDHRRSDRAAECRLAVAGNIRSRASVVQKSDVADEMSLCLFKVLEAFRSGFAIPKITCLAASHPAAKTRKVDSLTSLTSPCEMYSSFSICPLTNIIYTSATHLQSAMPGLVSLQQQSSKMNCAIIDTYRKPSARLAGNTSLSLLPSPTSLS